MNFFWMDITDVFISQAVVMQLYFCGGGGGAGKN